MSNISYLPWVSPNEEPAAEPIFLNADATAPIMQVEPLEIVDEAVRQVADDDEIYDALLRKLGVADMTQGEVESWLDARDVSPELIGDWLERLQRLGYVDDRRVAENLIRKLTLRKGQGRTAVSMELRRRKVPGEVINELLAERGDAAELDIAIAQATSRASSLTRLERSVAERRLQGFLMRRGFSGDIVREAVRAALTEYPPVG